MRRWPVSGKFGGSRGLRAGRPARRRARCGRGRGPCGRCRCRCSAAATSPRRPASSQASRAAASGSLRLRIGQPLGTTQRPVSRLVMSRTFRPFSVRPPAERRHLQPRRLARRRDGGGAALGLLGFGMGGGGRLAPSVVEANHVLRLREEQPAQHEGAATWTAAAARAGAAARRVRASGSSTARTRPMRRSLAAWRRPTTKTISRGGSSGRCAAARAAAGGRGRRGRWRWRAWCRSGRGGGRRAPRRRAGGGRGRRGARARAGGAGEERAAGEREGEEEDRGEGRAPARHAPHLGVDHRGGDDGGERQRRGRDPEPAGADAEEHPGGGEEGEGGEGGDGEHGLAAEPGGAPLAEGLEEPGRLAEVEEAGEEADGDERVRKRGERQGVERGRARRRRCRARPSGRSRGPRGW